MNRFLPASFQRVEPVEHPFRRHPAGPKGARRKLTRHGQWRGGSAVPVPHPLGSLSPQLWTRQLLLADRNRRKRRCPCRPRCRRAEVGARTRPAARTSRQCFSCHARASHHRSRCVPTRSPPSPRGHSDRLHGCSGSNRPASPAGGSAGALAETQCLVGRLGTVGIEA